MPRPILLFQDQYVLIDSRCRARYCWNNHYPTVVYPTWIHLPSVSHLQLGWQKSAIWVIMGNFSVPELPSRRNILFSPDGQRGRVPHLSPERGAPPPPPSIHPEPNTHTHPVVLVRVAPRRPLLNTQLSGLSRLWRAAFHHHLWRLRGGGRTSGQERELELQWCGGLSRRWVDYVKAEFFIISDLVMHMFVVSPQIKIIKKQAQQTAWRWSAVKERREKKKKSLKCRLLAAAYARNSCVGLQRCL